MAPAIRLAERGFTVTPYLADCITDCADRPAPLPGPVRPAAARRHAARRRQRAAAARSTPTRCARSPPRVRRRCTAAAWATRWCATCARTAAWSAWPTSPAVRVLEREPVHGAYRGWSVLGPPPPSSGGVHITQMLNILEGYDIAAMGFGSPDATHLLAEVLKIAFADRAVATADPAFVTVPVDRLIVQGLRRASAAPASTWPGRRPGGRGWTPAESRQHHPRDRGGRRRHGGQQHADHQRPVGRPLRGAGHRADPEQLHAELRPLPGRRAVDAAGQARVHLHGADDGAARRPDPRSRSGCRVRCASSAPRCRRWSTCWTTA